MTEKRKSELREYIKQAFDEMADKTIENVDYALENGEECCEIYSSMSITPEIVQDEEIIRYTVSKKYNCIPEKFKQFLAIKGDITMN